MSQFDDISREGLIDMLEEATERLEEKSALIRELKNKLETIETKANKDAIAYLYALGDALPQGHDGKLSDGTEPENYIADALRKANDETRDQYESRYIHSLREILNSIPESLGDGKGAAKNLSDIQILQSGVGVVIGILEDIFRETIDLREKDQQ